MLQRGQSKGRHTTLAAASRIKAFSLVHKAAAAAAAEVDVANASVTTSALATLALHKAINKPQQEDVQELGTLQDGAPASQLATLQATVTALQAQLAEKDGIIRDQQALVSLPVHMQHFHCGVQNTASSSAAPSTAPAGASSRLACTPLPC